MPAKPQESGVSENVKKSMLFKIFMLRCSLTQHPDDVDLCTQHVTHIVACRNWHTRVIEELAKLQEILKGGVIVTGQYQTRSNYGVFLKTDGHVSRWWTKGFTIVYRHQDTCQEMDSA